MDGGFTKGNVTHSAHRALDCRPVCAYTVSMAVAKETLPTREKGTHHVDDTHC